MYLAGFVVTPVFDEEGWVEGYTFTPQVGKALGLRITLGGYDGGFEAWVG